MVSSLSDVSKNISAIRKTIERHSTAPEKVRILGVTKFQPLERVVEVVDSGVTLLGVNYVQDGQKLREEMKQPNLEWHFIGHIQSRKAKHLLEYQCVQSLDRLDIAADLNRRAETMTKSLDILVEVNIGLEPQKSGVIPAELDKFLSELRVLTSLNVKGLMAMPPPLTLEERRPFFKQMRVLFDRYSEIFPFDTLSLGTSDDYAVALEEGSNLIRLGTCLFGPRW